MTTGNFDSWNPYIIELTQQELDNTPNSAIEEVFDVKTTNRLTFIEGTYSGLVPMTEVGEMGVSVENNFTESWKLQFQRRNWRQSVVFSKNLLDTNLTDALRDRNAEYVRNTVDSRDLNVYSLLRNAWTNSGLFAYPWGKALASTSIPLKNASSTFATTFLDGTQRAFGYDSLDLARKVLASQVSDSGNLLRVADADNEMCIMVTPNNAELAYQIAGAQAPETRPDTANRAGNFFVKGSKYTVYVNKWLSYQAARLLGETTVAQTSASNYWDTMWAVVDMKLAKKYWKFYESEGYYYFDTEINKKNESIIEYAYDSYCFGIISPIGVFLSKGDGSAYSG